MKVLVTGGAGFIGSNIVDMLIENHIDTYVIDNLSTGKKENLNPKAIFYKIDITDKALILDIFNEIKPEICIHHAAQISVQRSLQQPEIDAQVNIIGTINVLDACIKNKVKKVIYASSASVYGEPKYLPIDEGHVINPISCYGISKYSPEHYIKIYNHIYDLNYTILRYSNVYGIRQDAMGEGGVISIFLDKVLKDEAPVIYGDGTQTRDFIYVKDVAAANLSALSKGDGEILNIGTNTYVSLNELIKTIEEITGKKIKAKYEEGRAGDIMHSYMSNEKARTLLGFNIKYNLHKGLSETYKYIKKVAIL